MNIVFKFDAVKPKQQRIKKEVIKQAKFAVACLDYKNQWVAEILNTKNIPDIPNNLVCDFTERSFNIEGRVNVFRKEFINNKWVTIRFIRDTFEVLGNVGFNRHIALRENGIFSGILFKLDGKYYFDMKDYVGYRTKSGECIVDNSYSSLDSDL